MGIQNPGPQKFWEVKSRALSKFTDFIVCVSSCLELHYTNITPSTDIQGDFLTGAPLNFLSSISYVNWSEISLSARDCKGI